MHEPNAMCEPELAHLRFSLACLHVGGMLSIVGIDKRDGCYVVPTYLRECGVLQWPAETNARGCDYPIRCIRRACVLCLSRGLSALVSWSCFAFGLLLTTGGCTYFFLFVGRSHLQACRHRRRFPPALAA